MNSSTNIRTSCCILNHVNHDTITGDNIESFVVGLENETKQNSPDFVADDQASGDTRKRKWDSTSRSSESDVNLRASNFPIKSLQIGSWKRKAAHDDELRAKCYFSRKTFAWEVLDNNLKYKFEFTFSDIDAISSTFSADKEVLLIRLKNRPTFCREEAPQPKKHTSWHKCTDFTNQIASKIRVHELEFSPGGLKKHYDKIKNSNSLLRELSTKKFPINESHFFDDSQLDSFTNQISPRRMVIRDFPTNSRALQLPVPIQGGHWIYGNRGITPPLIASFLNDVSSPESSGRTLPIPNEWSPRTYAQVNPRPPVAMNQAMIPSAAAGQTHWAMNKHAYASSIPRFLNNIDVQMQTVNQARDHNRVGDLSAVISQLPLRYVQPNGYGAPPIRPFLNNIEVQTQTVNQSRDHDRVGDLSAVSQFPLEFMQQNGFDFDNEQRNDIGNNQGDADHVARLYRSSSYY